MMEEVQRCQAILKERDIKVKHANFDSNVLVDEIEMLRVQSLKLKAEVQAKNNLEFKHAREGRKIGAARLYIVDRSEGHQDFIESAGTVQQVRTNLRGHSLRRSGSMID